MSEESKAETWTVPLTDDQYDRLWEERRKREMVDQTIANLVLELSERLARQEVEMWDTVYRLAGVNKHNRHIKIDWMNRCIVVTETD